MSDTQQPAGIVGAIAAICGELAKTGIAKDKRASGYGASFSFRGIDDVQAALAPLLASHGVTITPEAEACEMSTRQTAKGGVMYHALVRVRFTLRHKDGSSYAGDVFGEACDNGDKAVGKAMSYAFKSFALQAFCVPTESTILDDPDATTHEPSKPAKLKDTPKVKPFDLVEDALQASNEIEDEAGVRAWSLRVQASGFEGDDLIACREAKAAARDRIPV